LSKGGFIDRDEKMAGKNDCGMAGNNWRETGGGKELARTYGGKILRAKGCTKYVIVYKKNPGSVRGKKWWHAPVSPQQAN